MATINTISNFIPISRKLFKHSLWLENRPYSRFEAWLDLLATARFDNSEGSMLIGCTLVRWNRGEMVASLRYLATRWGWKLNKVNNFINLIKHEEMIKTRTAEGTIQTIITICNYESYNPISKITEQQNKQHENSTRTLKEQPENKTNIDNKEQESKNREIYRGFAHLALFTHEYFELIDLGYTKIQIDATLDAIENFKNNKKYVSLFLTAKKWLASEGVGVAAATLPNNTGRIVNIASAFEQAMRQG